MPRRPLGVTRTRQSTGGWTAVSVCTGPSGPTRQRRRLAHDVGHGHHGLASAGVRRLGAAGDDSSDAYRQGRRRARLAGRLHVRCPGGTSGSQPPWAEPARSGGRAGVGQIVRRHLGDSLWALALLGRGGWAGRAGLRVGGGRPASPGTRQWPRIERRARLRCARWRRLGRGDETPRRRGLDRGRADRPSERRAALPRARGRRAGWLPADMVVVQVRLRLHREPAVDLDSGTSARRAGSTGTSIARP